MGIGSTSLINVAPGRVVIHTEGLRELSKMMSAIDVEVTRYSATGIAAGPISKVFAGEMKQAAAPIADLAQRFASALGGSGDFASSISITGGRSGIYLRSTDPGAGAIEFSRPGTLHAPHSGGPPRALFRAINDELPEVAVRVGDAVTAAINDYLALANGTPD